MRYTFTQRLLFILMLGMGTTYAQNNIKLPQIIPASPEASAIAKYINYPVSYSRGLAEVTIPIYEVKVGDLVMPVTISFHGAGLRVNEPSGWLGSSWTLLAEPGISRSIQGQPDETGYITNNNASYPDFPNEPNNFYKSVMANGTLDEEPDHFYFKLLQRSGSFYFHKKPRTSDPYQIITHPYEPVKINYIDYKTWEITDDNGVHYQFGTDDAYTESNVGGHRTAWKAKKITSSATGESITFTYHPYTDEDIINMRDMVVIEDNISDPRDVFRSECSGANDYPYFPLVKHARGADAVIYRVKDNGELVQCGQTSFPVGMNTVRSVKIKEIIFNNGKIVFDKGADGNLSTIRVFNNEGLVKQFRFIQSYYKSFNTGAAKRTKLDAVEILDASGNVMGKYSFEYNTMPVPDRNSRSIDYWGYNNDAYNEITGLVPLTQVEGVNFTAAFAGQRRVNFQIGGGQREANDYMMAGALTRITYPTKGYTEFEYQTNKYWNHDNNRLMAAGGVRIAKIRNYDPVTNKKLVRIFKYGKNENSAGYIKTRITSEEFYSEQVNYYRIATSSLFQPISVYTTRNRIYHCNTLTDLFYSNGAPVVYDEVAEYQTDEATGAALGKTVYKYGYNDSFYSTPVKIPGTTVTVDPQNDWMRGHLLAKEEYNSNNELVSKASYQYSLFNFSNIIAVGKAYRRKNLIFEDNEPAEQHEDIYYAPYTLQSGIPLLTSDTLLTRNGSQEHLVARTYRYDNLVHLNPTVTTTTGSDGKLTTTSSKYPHDVTLTGNAETGRVKLLENWRINTVLEQTETKGGATQKIKTEYNLFHGRALPVLVQTNTGNGDETRLRYHEYDTKGNLLSVSKENDVKVSYLWGYNDQYPIAEAKRAESNEIFSVDFENVVNATIGQAHTGIKFWNGDYTVNFTRPNAKPYRLSYWYREGGIWKSTEQEYTTSSVYLTPGDAIDDIRIFPAGSEMTTYTYMPLVGMTSATDANNKTTYYEYDNAGRLKDIKDHDGNIVAKWKYKYAGMPNQYFYNDLKSQAFTANNCSAGAGGTSVAYVVRANKHASLISKADADQEAQNDINANGQAYANEQGTCLFYNDQMKLIFTRNNCGGKGTEVTYTVAANTYSSAISKADANAKAQAEITNNGQNKANAEGYCLSTDLSGHYSKEACGPNQEPVPLYISVPAGTYTSPVSTAAANEWGLIQTQNHANMYGQCRPLTITLQFMTSYPGYTLWMKNVATNVEYEFSMDNSSGQVPLGTYHITFRGETLNRKFSTGCNPPQASNVFYNIQVHQGCNTMYVGNYN